jgi:hypothetical protein
MYSSVRAEVGGPPFAGFRHCRPTLFSSPVLKIQFLYLTKTTAMSSNVVVAYFFQH